MGCESSHLNQLGDISISIVDPAFSRVQNQKLKEKLSQNKIKHDFYISVKCFIDQFMRRYVNEVVAGVDNYSEVYQKLKQLNFTPNIYIIGKYPGISSVRTSIEEIRKLTREHKQEIKQIQEIVLPDNLIFIENYDQLIKILQQKNLKVRRIDGLQQKLQKKNGENKIDVKILNKPNARQTSQEMIFQSTLKTKGLSYEIYQNFQQLERSILEKDSHFIVTDYVYHKEVVALVSKTKTRVICSCTLAEEESYDPQVYFISNNFLEISSEIANERSLNNLNNVDCEVIYFYTVGIENPKYYAQVIEDFNFQVRIFTDLDRILRQTTFFFCVTILAGQDQIKSVQKYLHRNQCSFKVKVISLDQNVEPTVASMRKILKQFKKGYKAEKGLTNSIDFIDKNFDNVKFGQIKSELESNSIKCFGYFNLNNYTKQKKFISPFIICGYQERVLIFRYLKQVESSAKLIVFCNKSKISNQLKNDKNFAYVSNNFGKIISFIKMKEVFKPVVYGEDQIKLNEKVEKLKNRNIRISALKNKRISALKQCAIQNFSVSAKEIALGSEEDIKQDQFQFINISKNASLNQIRNLQKDAAILWKLDYKPFSSSSSFSSFKRDLADSLAKLRKTYKINYRQSQLAALLNEIKIQDIGMLLSKVGEFFDPENELGLSINSRLRRIQILNKNDITCLREFIFLANLNFISIYRMPCVDKVKLIRWISHEMIQNCQVGSLLLTKNYVIFEQENSINLNLSSHKIVTEINFDTLLEGQLNISSFFKYKGKYIFSPYSQFIIKNIITDLTGITQISLEYVKNVEYLKCFYYENLLKEQSFVQLFRKAIRQSSQNEKKLSPMVDFRILPRVRLNYQRIIALKAFREDNYQLAIYFHQKIIKEQQEQENLDSVKINELNYELAYFYLKNGQIQQAKNSIQKVRYAKPCSYLLERCNNILDDVVQQLNNIKDKSDQYRIIDQNRQSENYQKNQLELQNFFQSQKSIKSFAILYQNQGDADEQESSQQSQNSIVMQSQSDKQLPAQKAVKKVKIFQEVRVLRELKNANRQVGCLQIDDQEACTKNKYVQDLGIPGNYSSKQVKLKTE